MIQDLVIIGAGPVGLAAAAHAVQRGLKFIVLEKGESAGASIQQWGHVRLFSPWRYNVDRAARTLLEAAGWNHPPEEELHTGEQLVSRYIKPLSSLPQLAPNIHYRACVQSVGRDGMDKVNSSGRIQAPFVVHYEQHGTRHRILARHLVDASGTWGQPNPIGAGGIAAEGESDHAERISYTIPDVGGTARSRYAGQTIAIVGSGHSAMNSLLDLAELKREHPDTALLWILRKPVRAQVFGGGESDQLPARGELGSRLKRLIDEAVVRVVAPLAINAIQSVHGKLEIIGVQNGQEIRLNGIDEIIGNTGARPDVGFLREVRVQFDASLECVPALADLIDPNEHSCGTVRPHGELELRQPEPNLYIAGSKSYGRAPTFLMATGYEQVRSIIAAIAGDHEAAQRVELELPETGVCSVDGDCCGGPQLIQIGRIARK